MEFSDVVLKRRIVRNFTDEPVDPDVVARIMDLTRHAPSAGYTQGQSFVVITDPDMRKAVARLCGEEEYYPGQGFGPWISKAPVMVIACVSETAYHKRYQEPDKVLPDGTEIDWPVPYWYMDVGCGVMILLLAVVNEGLAAGFTGTHDWEPVRQLLGIPDDVLPVGVIPIGHKAPDVPSPSLKRGRKPLEDYVHYEKW